MKRIGCLKRIVFIVSQTTRASKCNRKVDRSFESLTEAKCSVEMCDANPKILRQALEILSKYLKEKKKKVAFEI